MTSSAIQQFIVIQVLMDQFKKIERNIIISSIDYLNPKDYLNPNPNYPQPKPPLSSEELIPAGRKRKKKFMTRLKEFNPQSSCNLAQSYQLQQVLQRQAGCINARQKNNQSAKESRKRKKMYIEMLQEQNTNMEQQLYSINDEIEMMRTQIFNAIMHTDEDSNNAEIQSLVIKKLRTLTQMDDSNQNDTEINICLDSCIYRIGASGSQRRAILDILYKGFINRHLPNIYRFIIWASIARFQPQPLPHDYNKNWGWDIIKCNMLNTGFQSFFQQRGDIVAEKGKEILKCSRKILSVKREIESSGQLFDGFVKEMRRILTPCQSAQLYLFAEKAIPKRQLQLFQEEDEREKEVGREVIDLTVQGGRKKRKIEYSSTGRWS